MNPADLRKLTNRFQDVRLVSLRTWPQAAAYTSRDHGGPYVVLQEGYAPEDLAMKYDEFLLGKSGTWLSLGRFYRLPVPERRAEYVFGTAAEVMQLMERLPGEASVLTAAVAAPAGSLPTEGDEMAAAIQAGLQDSGSA